MFPINSGTTFLPNSIIKLPRGETNQGKLLHSTIAHKIGFSPEAVFSSVNGANTCPANIIAIRVGVKCDFESIL